MLPPARLLIAVACAIAFCLPVRALARTPQSDSVVADSALVEDALDALLEDVVEIGIAGSPGDVVAFGDQAFVVVAGAGGVPVVAAAHHGRGRVLILGHGGYVGPGVIGQADHATFTKNAMQWLSGGKRKPTIATPHKADLGETISTLGFRAAADTPLNKADVVIVQPRDFSPAEMDELVAFVEGGGGLMTAATPWGWQQLNPKLAIPHDLPVQQLVVRFGLGFGRGNSGKTGTVGYLTSPRPDRWTHAGNAYLGLRDGNIPAESIAPASARLRAWLGAMPDHEPTLGREIRTWIEADEAPRDITDAYAKRTWRPLSFELHPWHLIGPFKGGKDLATPQSPEKLLEALLLDGPGPDLAGDLRGMGGRVPWRALAVKGPGGDGGVIDAGIVRFDQSLIAPPKTDDWTDRASAYAYRRMTATEPRELTLRLGAADGVRVWMNGALILDRPEAGGIDLGETDLILHVEPGVNHLLVKVRNESGPWGFRLRTNDVISQEAINAAIDKGVDFLLKRQLVDGSWHHEHRYGVGFSAYALYALIKSGVDPQHAAVRRALAYVEANHGEHTYASACRILALSAIKDASIAEIRDSTEQLIAWQEGDGTYAYPVHPGSSGGHAPDLSNTLYAALALRAASKRGVEVPDRTWEGLIEGTLRYWSRGGSSKARRQGGAAGFSYRPGGNATGSMTTAGVTVLAIARDALGERLDKRTAKEVEQALAGGVAWVETHLSWRENPGQPQRWHHFFLYGVERVGALLKLDVLGDVSWYWSGAEYLVGAQQKDGNWKAIGGSEGPVDTVLALLFLTKATAPVSGRDTISDRAQLTAKGDVEIQGVGTDPLAVWITGWSDDRVRDLGDPPRVTEVNWVVRDEGGAERVAATVKGDLEGGQLMQRYEARVSFGAPGKYTVFARVEALVPPETVGLQPKPTALESPPIEIEIAGGQVASFGDYARHAQVNLLRGAEVEASTSAGNDKPGNAVDGLHGSWWKCANNDAAPSIRAKLTPPRPASELFLSHAMPMTKDQGAAQAADIEVVLNGEVHLTATTEPDRHGKTKIELPPETRVSTLQIFVRSARNGELGQAALGFSEIELIP